jgi:aminoglycoside phosphotransferase (APT) family kinase protein
MYLTASTVLPYLVQKGLLSESNLVRNDWFVARYERRPVLHVSSPAASGWIVKQASPIDIDHVLQINREAAIYQLAERDVWACSLRKLLPRFCAYDSGVHALIVQQVAQDTAWDYLRRSSAQPRMLGRLLGRAFAGVHVPVSSTAPPVQFLSGQRPWILELDRADLSSEEKPSTRAVVDLIRAERPLMASLSRLRRDWRRETLVHNDAKLDNALVRAAPRPRVWLIDWELAGHGDPAWDVGSMLQSGLVLWLNGISFRKDEEFAEAAQRSTFPLSLAQSFGRSFLSTYIEARTLTSGAAPTFIRRAFRFAGARLVQSAFEHARTLGHFTLRHLAMLQVSKKILEDPDGASADMLADS